LGKQRKKTGCHYEYFRVFGKYRDRALAVFISEITGISGKQYKRDNEQSGGNRNIPAARFRLDKHIYKKQGDQYFERVVVKRTEKLRYGQRPETFI